MYSNIIKTILFFSLLLIFIGCDDSSSSGGSTGLTSTSASGTWILIKDIEYETDGSDNYADTITYTEQTSDEIIVISPNNIYAYYDDDIETMIEVVNINPGTSLKDAFIQYLGADDEPGVTGSVTMSGNNLVVKGSMVDGNYTYGITLTYAPYTGAVPPAHWPAIPTEDIPSNPTTLTTSSNISDNISNEGDVLWYTIDATSGMTYTMTTSGYLDSHLRLYEVNGSELKLISANDDYNDDLNSMIIWKCSTSGTYYLSVRGFDDYETGNFGLTLASTRKTQIPTGFLEERKNRKRSKAKVK